MPRPVEMACAFGALIGMTKVFRESIRHYVLIFIKSCSAKKIRRAAFSGAGCQRAARGYGLRRWGYGLGRWGYGLGRCQLGSNQLENLLEFLGVEMLKIRGVLCLGCGGQHLTFLKEADAAAAQRFRWDLRLWDSTVRIRFLLSSTIFYPKSDTYIFSTSQWYILIHFVHQRWHQNKKTQEETVNCHWIGMLISHLEPRQRRHPPGGLGRRRPGHAALPPCRSGARAREKCKWLVASK